MSTQNIGFYEDLAKIIFQLSSNIIRTFSLKKQWTEIKFNLTPPYKGDFNIMGAPLAHLVECQT